MKILENSSKLNFTLRETNMKTEPFDCYSFIMEYEKTTPRPEVILPTKLYRAMKDGVIKIFSTRADALQFSSLVETFLTDQEESIKSMKELKTWQIKFESVLEKERREYYDLDENVYEILNKRTPYLIQDDSDYEPVFFELYRLYMDLKTLYF